MTSCRAYSEETERHQSDRRATDGKGSLLCTWCQKRSGIRPWRLSWRCPRCCLGNQADIWGFWPGARLWHTDGWGRRGGGGPEDHLPRVSDSFSLDYHAFNLSSLLQLLFLPFRPLPSTISGSHLTFWRLVFLVILLCVLLSLPLHRSPFWHTCLFSSASTSLQPAAPLSLFLSPSSPFFFVFLVPFLFHFIIIHRGKAMKNRCRTTLSVITVFFFLILKARSQPRRCWHGGKLQFDAP